MDPRERFSQTVDDYRRYRPDYPDALFEWIGKQAGLGEGSVVIDVGCGTGISTRQLAGRGWRVIGADPNPAMLEAARADTGERDDVSYVLTDAETLAVPVDHCDAIVGGQAFHWFDLDRALARFAELLGAGGSVIAFWNLRDSTEPAMAAYEELLRLHCSEYAEVGAEPRADALIARLGKVDRAFFPHHQDLDREAFHGRVWSSSYVRHGVAHPQAFDDVLDALFERHARNGVLRFTYKTTAIAFTI